MTPIQLTFSQKPANGGAMFKALVLPRAGFSVKVGLPNIQASWTGATVDTAALQEYLTVLDLKTDTVLPVLYPHVMAGSMHMNMLSHKAFPIRLLGAVHLKNRIVQHSAISIEETMDFHSEIGAYRLVEKGVEFDFSTRVVVAGQTAWEEVSTYFMAGKFGGRENPSSETSFDLSKLESANDQGQWHVPANRGKQYAKITGDYNPIHMSSLAAKLFGFKRDIAHGFGVLAQGIQRSSAWAGVDMEKPLQVDVIFKGPVFLDSQVSLKEGNNSRFDIYCGSNPKPSICAQVSEA